MAQGVPPLRSTLRPGGEGYERAPNIAGRFAWGPRQSSGFRIISISEGPKRPRSEIVATAVIDQAFRVAVLLAARPPHAERERPRDDACRLARRSRPDFPTTLLAGVTRFYAAHEQRAADAMLDALGNRTS